MDEPNIRIRRPIAELQAGSSDEIAEYTEVLKSTVYDRIAKLEGDDIVTIDLPDVGLEILGPEIAGITEYSHSTKSGITMRSERNLPTSKGQIERLSHGGRRDHPWGFQFVGETNKYEPGPLHDFELEAVVKTTMDGK
ncbi:hypothetical protein [Natrinema halophilum]|uniref:hypothetical protein n=1 Tax=Natrinema halophilum TaxID=1699371 RepID=UPI001F26E1C7|nr:hypothetical protein [Natrinema halophilum]UHQ96054.1 hypothetical protein HYG82_06640 [Natrinema halophilum]